MKWTQEDTNKLEELKKSLVHAPVLSLPDLKRPFFLFVNIEEGIAFGVLTQDWAGKKKPVAFLSKILDPVSRGWPTCLQMLAGCALLVEEARKITFNSSLKVLSPHNIRGVMQQKADKWISDARLLKYEGILLEAPDFTLETTTLQNPAAFLYGEMEQGPLTHDCLATIEEQTKIRPDLEEEELDEGERLFVDGSSRIVEGERKSGYAIIGGTDLRVIESGALDKSWSAQACELYAILRALTLLKGKEGTIYTDSKYGFGVVHTFGKLWEERGLINSQGKGLIHQKLIVEVLQALRGPKKIAVVHLKGHQPGIDFKSRGNNAADQEAKRAAVREMVLKEKPQIRETLEKEDVETTMGKRNVGSETTSRSCVTPGTTGRLGSSPELERKPVDTKVGRTIPSVTYNRHRDTNSGERVDACQPNKRTSRSVQVLQQK
ncbi:uncharacterized protein LOC117005097 [Catharus ustulatus]|uniref:uncharacterized protein LOC117005097 n=1 Tax=Catharus ustulatus TaxID=91951 RepID=UPI00140DEB6E|nr:uncharacterized protein LOC117005097 [Catharus ustulatus]